MKMKKERVDNMNGVKKVIIQEIQATIKVATTEDCYRDDIDAAFATACEKMKLYSPEILESDGMTVGNPVFKTVHKSEEEITYGEWDKEFDR